MNWLIKTIFDQLLLAFVKKVEVLVKGKGKRENQYRGTTKWMQVVNFTAKEPVNSLETVNLTKTSNNSLLGEV